MSVFPNVITVWGTQWAYKIDREHGVDVCVPLQNIYELNSTIMTENLTYWGLVMPYGVREHGQDWYR